MALVSYIVERDDADELTAFVEEHSARIPTRELEVFLLCITRKMSAAAAAKELGISRRTVENYLYNLRARVRSTTAAASDSARGAA